MGISALIPFQEILENHGEIGKKPLKNHTQKNDWQKNFNKVIYQQLTNTNDNLLSILNLFLIDTFFVFMFVTLTRVVPTFVARMFVTLFVCHSHTCCPDICH